MFHARYNHPFSPTRTETRQLASYLSEPRFRRYRAAAHGDPALAFRLYRWNTQLCEALYTPLHFLEVGLRNRVAAAFADRFGPAWALLAQSTRLRPLNKDARRLIHEAVKRVDRDNRGRHYGASTTVDKVVAELSFGFWARTLTSRYETVLWTRGLRPYFSGLPADLGRADLATIVGLVQGLRNRMAHHKPIFDLPDLGQRYCEIMGAVGWISPDMHPLVLSLSTFPAVHFASPDGWAWGRVGNGRTPAPSIRTR